MCDIILRTLFLLIAGVTVFAAVSETERINGENGWYVPQNNGDFEWIDLDVYEDLISTGIDTDTNTLGRIDTNKVDCYLYTRKNPDSPQIITDTYKSISQSYFNSSLPTKFVIHGWLQSDGSNNNEKIKSVWLAREDCNIIIVRWARAHLEYIMAVNSVESVGAKLANLIDYLYGTFDMSFDTLEVIGHSLGSHVAGYIGKKVKNGQIFHIVGLDPALPLFSYKDTKSRLCSDDGFYVETIQTNGDKLGFLKPIGKASFYPNGGKNQPGCILDVLGICSHERSVVYYVESIEKNNFPAISCDNYKDAVKARCGSTYSSTHMNSKTNFLSANGVFYVPINKKSPYGKSEPY